MRLLAAVAVVLLSGCAGMHVGPPDEPGGSLAPESGTLDSVVSSAGGSSGWEDQQRLAVAERIEASERRAATMRVIGQALQSVGDGLGQMGRPVQSAPSLYSQPTVHCTSTPTGYSVSTTCQQW